MSANLLFVDASADRDQHANALEDHLACSVEREGSIEGALHHVSSGKYSCVICGRSMLDGDPSELLLRLREAAPSLPLIPIEEMSYWSGEDPIPRIAEQVREIITPAQRVSIVTVLSEVVAARASTNAEPWPAILEIICQSTAWNAAELWVPNDNGTLERVALRRSSGETTSTPVSIPIITTFPGVIWASQQDEWVVSAGDPLSPVSDTAGTDEFRTIYGVPIGDEGILVCYAADELDRNHRSQWIVHELADFLEQQLNTNGRPSASSLEATLLSAFPPIDLFVDHIDVTLWMTTADFEILYTSPNFERIADMPPDEFHANPEMLIELVHPDDREEVEKCWQNRHSSYALEYRIITASGETRWIHEQGTPIPTEEEPCYFIGTARDVTDSKRQTDELQRYRELLGHTEELGRIGGWEADITTGTARWTDGTRAIHGVSDEFQPNVERGIDFFHPDDQSTIESVFARCAESGEPYDVELRLITSTEQLIWVRATGEPVYEGDEITHVRGAIQDITDRKNRERELHRERELLRQTERLAQSGGWMYQQESDTLHLTPGCLRLFGREPGETLDLRSSFAYYHPQDRQVLMQAFDRCLREGTPYELEVRIIGEDGTERWVHEHGERTNENGAYLVRGAIRDISVRKRYEQSLQVINQAGQEVLKQEAVSTIAQRIADAAAELSGASGAAILLYDEQAEGLVPIATAGSLSEWAAGPAQFSPGSNLPWMVFTRGLSIAPGDELTDCDPLPQWIGDAHVHPLSNHGVLILQARGHAESHVLPGELVEMINRTAVAAFDRAERHQALRKRERESLQQAEQLQQLSRLNEDIRAIVKSVVQAGSRESICHILCDTLYEHDQFSGVWVGDPDYSSQRLCVQCAAGDADHLLADMMPLTGNSSFPAMQAKEKREPIIVSDVAARPAADTWRHTALIHDIRSIASVPLLFGDVLYGVLTMHSAQPSTFDALTTSVLTELGELVGYIINSVAERNALLADELIELTFVLQGADDVFVDLATACEATIHIDNILKRSEFTFLVHFTVEDVNPERVLEIATRASMISEIEVVADEPNPRFEAITVGECVGTELADMGAHLRTIAIAEDACELCVSIPPNRDIRSIVNQLTDRYVDVELVTQRHTSVRPPTSRQWLVQEHLTNRQATILQTAFFSGYFDTPRKRTGVEIAASLDISQPGFAKQLRRAQYRLFEALFTDT